jgi:hypothetical protein
MTAGSHRFVFRALAAAFGGVFVLAGAVKLRDPQLFLLAIRNFRILPDPFSAWLALGLPWIEIFSGMAVCSGCLRRGGLLLLNACLVMFLAAIAFAWWRGLDIECGCFGSTFKADVKMEFAIDVLLLGAGLWLMRREKSFS